MVNKLFIFYLFKIQIKIQIQTQIKIQIKKKIRKTQLKQKINKYKKEFIIVKIVDVNYKTQLY